MATRFFPLMVANFRLVLVAKAYVVNVNAGPVSWVPAAIALIANALWRHLAWNALPPKWLSLRLYPAAFNVALFVLVVVSGLVLSITELALAFHASVTA